jgi:ABC-type transporter MlaC component
MHANFALAGAPGDRVRETVDNLLTILKDPRLKGDSKKIERRKKLREVINQRFDFTEMAKRSLGPEWRRRSAAQQNEFVKLFTDLLEQAYLEQIESYNGEKVQYLKEREENTNAEVSTKVVDNRGQEFPSITGCTKSMATGRYTTSSSRTSASSTTTVRSSTVCSRKAPSRNC